MQPNLTRAFKSSQFQLKFEYNNKVLDGRGLDIMVVELNRCVNRMANTKQMWIQVMVFLWNGTLKKHFW